MLKYYYVLHSTVTNYIIRRLLSITNQKLEIMRTLNTNQLKGTLSSTKSFNWNSKRRYR